MVNTTEYAEGKFLTADLVKASPSKTLVILGEAKPQEVEYNGKKETRLEVNVEIDGKTKLWRPNQDSVKNLQTLGVDSKFWNGAVVKLTVMSGKGKDMVIAMPEPKPNAAPHAAAAGATQ